MIERYETPEIKAIWNDRNRFQKWLDVELAVCKAWNEAGKIPDEDYLNIVSKHLSVSRGYERSKKLHSMTSSHLFQALPSASGSQADMFILG